VEAAQIRRSKAEKKAMIQAKLQNITSHLQEIGRDPFS
jgi:hypothetical protein